VQPDTRFAHRLYCFSALDCYNFHKYTKQLLKLDYSVSEMQILETVVERKNIMDHTHPSYQLQVIKSEYSQYETGYRAETPRFSNFAPLRGILRSLGLPQRR
jgi:hypothetical protein